MNVICPLVISIKLLYTFDMAKTSFQEIPLEFDLTYSKALTSGDRFTFPRVRVNTAFSTRAKKKGVTQKSLIVSLLPVWNGFTQTVRDAWNASAIISGLTGYKLFIQDTALRIANDISGYATPNLIYQAKVGRLNVASPATGILITQEHPLSYYVQRKVKGTRSQYEAVNVLESFDLPVNIKISYKTNLTSAGGSPRARFYLDVLSHYQGRNISTILEIPFALVADWQTGTASLSNVLGRVRGYTAFLEINDARGDLWVDNIEINHSGHNWTRDPRCNDIHQSFTRAFYQIPAHWAVIHMPTGAFFDSVYYN
jgi:hypothetical protein